MQTLAELSSGKYRGITSLKLSEELTVFPREIFDLEETLEYLDLSVNLLSNLPEDFGRLKKLKVFFASENLFTTLPEVLSDCPELEIVGFKSNQIQSISDTSINPNLKWLILTNNRISSLPSSIGKCINMQKLMLAGNLLTVLPEALTYCKNLRLLRIAANQLSELPQWLTSMPSLAWLAFSGNRIKQNKRFEDPIQINPKNIELKNKLGEGASGTIYQASKIDNPQNAQVAVKVFKGNVTSDGYPEDEMNAYIASGTHESIVKLIGKINIGNLQKGVVMELISKDFFNLGNPPSLDSCTRDVFREDLKLSQIQAFQIATSIASVGEHLHCRGIMHGDLYAHNILVDRDGKTLFGDFGAASLYDPEDKITYDSLEKIEAKAYGYLLDDLLSITTTTDVQFHSQLTQLRDLCLSDKQQNRPSFAEIVESLSSVRAN